MAGGRLFRTRGPATANASSPSDVVVRGMSSIILAADQSAHKLPCDDEYMLESLMCLSMCVQWVGVAHQPAD